MPNGVSVASNANDNYAALSRVAPSGNGGYANVPRTPNPASLSHTSSGNTSASYTIKSGDTLSAIAEHYGVPLANLEAANKGITNPNLIFPGQHIDIPGSVAVPATSNSGVGGVGATAPKDVATLGGDATTDSSGHKNTIEEKALGSGKLPQSQSTTHLRLSNM